MASQICSASVSRKYLVLYHLTEQIFYFLDHTKYRESIQSVQKTNLEILMDLHVLRVTKSKKWCFAVAKTHFS